ncbi:MAG: TrmO family methyltransferase [Verrucomicrobiota bacterium]
MTDRCLGIRPFRIIRGIDALEGSPLLDIKPYIPRFDYHRNAGSGWVARVKNRRKPKGRE